MVIIDDAWNIEEALVFHMSGTQSAHLLTSRSPTLAAQYALHACIRVQELDESESLELLVSIAPDVLAQDLDEIRRLVQLLAGLPLALTLAGNFLHTSALSQQPRRIHMAIEQLVDAEERLRLANHTPLAEYSPYRKSGEPVTLQSAITVSDSSLSPALHRALRCLALFPAKPNSFSEEAAGFVCTLASGPLRSVLDSLHDAGLLESQGPGRYWLHQAIVDFARADLLASDNRDFGAAREGQVRWALGYLGRAGCDHDATQSELTNLLTCLDTARTLGAQDLFIQGVEALTPFLMGRGLFDLAEGYLSRGIEFATGDERLVAVFSCYLGQIYALRGERSRAVRQFRRSLDYAVQAHDIPVQVDVLRRFGDHLLRFGRNRAAMLMLERAFELTKDDNDSKQQALLLRLLGIAAECTGQFDRSKTLYCEGLRIARTAGDLEAIAELTQNLGGSAARTGDLESAEALLGEGLSAARTLGHRERMSALLNNLALTVHWRGNTSLGLQYIHQALDLAREVRHPVRLIYALQSKAYLAIELGDSHTACVDLEESLAQARMLGDPYLLCGSLSALADAHIRSGIFEGASSLLFESYHLAEGLHDAELIAYVRFGLARLAQHEGQMLRALRLGAQSHAYFASVGHMHARNVAVWLASLPSTQRSRKRDGVRGEPRSGTEADLQFATSDA